MKVVKWVTISAVSLAVLAACTGLIGFNLVKRKIAANFFPSVTTRGPVAFLDVIVELLKEVFDTSNRLCRLRMLLPYGATVGSTEQHVSHTVPALESLTTLHLLGAYIAKRNRFQYLKTMLRPEVYRVANSTAQQKKFVMAFWPLGTGQGEPDELQFRAGRIDYCIRRVNADVEYGRLFGSVR